VIYAAQRLGGLAKKYRAAARQSTSEVTGMIADMFNATQAIKVGNAELRVIGRFRQINDARREAMVRDRLLTQLVEALGGGTVDVGVGLILLVAAQAMFTGAFTVGDFALFVSYLGWLTQATHFFGSYVTLYRQMSVSLERLFSLLPDTRSKNLVEPDSTYKTGIPPKAPYTIKTPHHYLEKLDALRNNETKEKTDKNAESIIDMHNEG